MPEPLKRWDNVTIGLIAFAIVCGFVLAVAIALTPERVTKGQTAETASGNATPEYSGPENQTRFPQPASNDAANTEKSYASEAHEEASKRFALFKAAAMDKIRVASFATGCNVMSGAEAFPILGSQMLLLRQFATENGVNIDTPPGLNPEIEAVRREGFSAARKSGGCDYWHEHPDAVYDIRQEALIDRDAIQ